MKEDKKPYVARNECGVEFLVYADGLAIVLSEMNKGVKHEFTPRFEGRYKNITREYLQNTWGVVESKEHAEFIIELSNTNGFRLLPRSDSSDAFFATDDGSIIFTNHKDIASDDCKKITIPLPPKEVEEMKNNGDNLVLGCEDSKCEEWLKIGDEVTWGNGVNKGTVIAINNNLAWVKYSGDIYVTEYVSKLRKPKTPEEELQDELIDVFESSLDGGNFVGNLLSKFTVIAKKPQ